MSEKKLVKKVSYSYIHKLAAGVSLIALFVVMIAGLLAEASVISIALRSVVVIVIVAFASRLIITILSSYEEMNSGQG
jgi:hypothetical protein